jgi:hypothetical protein
LCAKGWTPQGTMAGDADENIGIIATSTSKAVCVVEYNENTEVMVYSIVGYGTYSARATRVIARKGYR